MTQNQKNNQRTINLDKIIPVCSILFSSKGSKLSACISCSHKGIPWPQSSSPSLYPDLILSVLNQIEKRGEMNLREEGDPMVSS